MINDNADTEICFHALSNVITGMATDIVLEPSWSRRLRARHVSAGRGGGGRRRRNRWGVVDSGQRKLHLPDLQFGIAFPMARSQNLKIEGEVSYRRLAYCWLPGLIQILLSPHSRYTLAFHGCSG